MEKNHIPRTFWNREYGLMCAANFLISGAVFMQFPLQEGMGWPFMALGVGMFLLGGFYSWLMDSYRRKWVCCWAVLGMMVASLALHFVTSPLLTIAGRLVEGMCFGVMEMSLGSTLINDLSVSSHRTQTDYYYLWTLRLSLPMAVVGASLLPRLTYYYMYIPEMLMFLGLLLVLGVKVPFRAPDGVNVLSLDRFLYPKAWVLTANLLPVMIVVGFLLSGEEKPLFIGMYGVGLFVAFLTHRGFFEEADDRADAVTGLLLAMAGTAIVLLNQEERILCFAYVLLGLGVGWFCSRFVLYFLKLSGHMQRGTMQNTYILTAMIGLCIGYSLTRCLDDGMMISQIGLALLVFSLVFYLIVTHRWFLRHNNRNFKFREV